jgi:uncharacterized protein YkwD
VGRKISISLALAALAGAALVPAAGAAGLSRLIAPASACPNQVDRDASAAVQERAMRCMTDFARRRAGMGRLADARALDRSALDKSSDILRCDSFSHFACGRKFTYWMQRVRYLPAPCWRVGENLAWGSGEYDSVRSIFSAWIHSPEHRANILGHYTQVGTGLRVGDLDGNQGVHVWTQHFGSHCGPAPRPAAPRREKVSRASVVTPAG